jgi:hypothetical protein
VRVGRGGAIGLNLFAFAPHVVLFNVEARQLFAHALVAACWCAPSHGALCVVAFDDSEEVAAISSTRPSSPSICACA